ncbi:elongation of very long chain fatty acids protein F-like [Drosophila serrata]|uniref:elongation of very long chain fatty acids protein F-like n=1 Tax=Drosophila serrata TaxID=7274 RepID=UPI000A1CFBF3|nr:elongation of very long chain fatty acids protein F-like [Drosophila serrata]
MLTPVDSEVAFTSSPWPTVAILASYLLFVLKVGPWLMADRKPFDLRGFIKAYNIFQILYNGSVAISTSYILFVLKPYDLTCPITLPQDNWLKGAERFLSNAYIINKFVDLLETVIFVLRKKDRQVSFLHLFHHIAMVLYVYIYGTLYGPGGSVSLMMLMNVIVHTIMYIYYFLSSISPAVQASLWWKKYITIAQLIQFAGMMMYCILILSQPDCQAPRPVAYVAGSLSATFAVMFGKFYYRTYVVKTRKKV